MMLKKPVLIKTYFKKMTGGEKRPSRKPHHKIIWSWLGAFLAIYLISTLHTYLDINSSFLIASFGASAVLVYGAPQAEFAQPRNLVGGHILSALVGISVYKYLPFDVSLLSALAVSLSIVAMHYTSTLHPPGGATALIAVIGGDSIHSLGFEYVLSPIGLGSLILLIVALLVNNLSSNPKRHYPSYWW